MHRQWLSRSLRLGIDQMPSSTPIVGMLDIEDLIDEVGFGMTIEAAEKVRRECPARTKSPRGRSKINDLAARLEVVP